MATAPHTAAQQGDELRSRTSWFEHNDSWNTNIIHTPLCLRSVIDKWVGGHEDKPDKIKQFVNNKFSPNKTCFKGVLTYFSRELAK
jgi:hypothetical protein